MNGHATHGPTRFVIRNGTVVGRRGLLRADVAVADGRIVEVGEGLSSDVVVEADGCFVSSGFVDLHAHLREPGREEAETIESGSRAAALGGYTAVVAMPNTNPAQDSTMVVDFVRSRGRSAGLCDVHPAGCITVGRAGTEIAPFKTLADAGVRIFTDDGNGVQDPRVMRTALEYASTLGVVLAQHCEVSSLTDGAVMHEGRCCGELGLPGWPSLAEELMLHRDIELVRMTGATMHFLHLSTAGSVELIREAKRDGLPVTAEVTPHHLSLDDELLAGFDSVFKVNPPLRTKDDISALRRGLLDGTIDAVATDHAPHTARDKELPLDTAPPGMLGLETALGVVNSSLDISPQRLVEVMSWNPARIAGLERHGREVAPGEPANLTVFDLGETWRVDAGALASLSRNSPYHGREITGRNRHTVLAGELVVHHGRAVR